MTSYSSLAELKTSFLQDSNMSSRHLFVEMEKTIFGSNNMEQYLNSLKMGGTGDEILNKVREKAAEVKKKTGRTQTIAERYPFLEGNVDVLDYTKDYPVEWDISSDGKGFGVGIYVYLDNAWVCRCSVGDDITVLQGDVPYGYRLKGV